MMPEVAIVVCHKDGEEIGQEIHDDFRKYGISSILLLPSFGSPGVCYLAAEDFPCHVTVGPKGLAKGTVEVKFESTFNSMPPHEVTGFIQALESQI